MALETHDLKSILSGRWESNPRLNLGKVAYYHYTTPANHYIITYLKKNAISRLLKKYYPQARVKYFRILCYNEFYE